MIPIYQNTALAVNNKEEILEKGSTQNYMYFTLPMALNYQRNSYVLRECANRMYADENAKLFLTAKKSVLCQKKF